MKKILLLALASTAIGASQLAFADSNQETFQQNFNSVDVTTTKSNINIVTTSGMQWGVVYQGTQGKSDHASIQGSGSTLRVRTMEDNTNGARTLTISIPQGNIPTIKISSNAGNVQVNGVACTSINVKAQMGNTMISGTECQIEVDSMKGNIQVNGVANRYSDKSRGLSAKLNTREGSITASVNGDLTASTTRGSIQATMNEEGRVKLESNKGSISAILNKPVSRMEIDSDDGSVSVRLPRQMRDTNSKKEKYTDADCSVSFSTRSGSYNTNIPANELQTNGKSFFYNRDARSCAVNVKTDGNFNLSL